MRFIKSFPLYKYILALFDFSALSLAFFIGLKVRFWPKIDLINNPDYLIHQHLWPLIVYAAVSVFVFQFFNLYKKHIFITLAQHQVLILKALFFIFTGYIIIAFASRYPQLIIDSRLVILFSIICACLLVSFFRLVIFRNLFLLFAKNELIRRRILIVGAGKSGKIVAASIISEKKYGLELVGFVDDNIQAGSKVFQSFIILGTTDEINDIVKMYNVHEIIICVSEATHEKLIELTEKCKKTGRLVQIYSNLYEVVSQKINVERFSEFPLIRMGQFYSESINKFIKRVNDIVGSLIAIIVFSPLYVLLAVLIKMDSPGPILFKQKRLGREGKYFTFLKFRTMHVNNDDKIHQEYLKNLIRNGKNALDGGKDGVFKLINDPRVTKIGAFLRKTSLDELPQFFNVLKGEMSIVGPRPALPYEVDEYNEWHHNRMKILPGITGLWQVSGRNKITFDDMVVLDMYYMENMSPWFDLQIMLKTIPILLGRNGY